MGQTILNTGQRRRFLTNVIESEGLPHMGVDPAGTSANCLRCGEKLKRLVAPASRNERNMWCQSCRMILERDAGAGANILLHTATVGGQSRIGGRRNVTLLLTAAVGSPDVGEQQRNILRPLEGVVQTPSGVCRGRQSEAGGESVG